MNLITSIIVVANCMLYASALSSADTLFYRAKDSKCAALPDRLFRVATTSCDGVSTTQCSAKIFTGKSSVSFNYVSKCQTSFSMDLPQEMGSGQYVVMENFVVPKDTPNTCQANTLVAVQALVADGTCVQIESGSWAKAACDSSGSNVWACSDSNCSTCSVVVLRKDASCAPAYDVGYSKVSCVGPKTTSKSAASSNKGGLVALGSGIIAALTLI